MRTETDPVSETSCFFSHEKKFMNRNAVGYVAAGHEVEREVGSRFTSVTVNIICRLLVCGAVGLVDINISELHAAFI
jgi:hypothetical protein